MAQRITSLLGSVWTPISKSVTKPNSLFAFLGAAVALKFAYKTLKWGYINFLRRNDMSKYKKKDAWAIVTGSTEGIGKAFAEELGKLGFNLFLVSRSREKLQNQQSQLEAAHHVRCQFYACDATKLDDVPFTKISDRLAGLEVTVLVNNVGIVHDIPTPLTEITPDLIADMIHVNTLFPVKLTQAVVPHLKKNKASCIINVSSFTAIAPSPYYSVYAATKAFNITFSRCTALELKEFGIDVLAAVPAQVVSQLNKVEPSLMIPAASTFAKSALNKVGLRQSTAYWFHAMPELLMAVMPESTLEDVSLNFYKTIREHELANQEEPVQQSKEKTERKKSS